MRQSTRSAVIIFITAVVVFGIAIAIPFIRSIPLQMIRQCFASYEESTKNGTYSNKNVDDCYAVYKAIPPWLRPFFFESNRYTQPDANTQE